jgi:hypothetical protein
MCVRLCLSTGSSKARGLDAFLLPIKVPVADLAGVVPGLAKLGDVKGFIITMAGLWAKLGPQAKTAASSRADRCGRAIEG